MLWWTVSYGLYMVCCWPRQACIKTKKWLHHFHSSLVYCFLIRVYRSLISNKEKNSNFFLQPLNCPYFNSGIVKYTITHDWDWTEAGSKRAQGCIAALAITLSHPHWLTLMTSERQAVLSASWEKYLSDNSSYQGSIQYNLMYVWNKCGQLFSLELNLNIILPQYKREHTCSFILSTLHELVHWAYRNYGDIVKTGIPAVGSHKKLTRHEAKLRDRPFDCGLKPPAVQRDMLFVWTPYKGQSPLVGSKDHQI